MDLAPAVAADSPSILEVVGLDSTALLDEHLGAGGLAGGLDALYPALGDGQGELPVDGDLVAFRTGGHCCESQCLDELGHWMPPSQWAGLVVAVCLYSTTEFLMSQAIAKVDSPHDPDRLLRFELGRSRPD